MEGGCIGERTGRGWGCGAQITSHHCYSPAQGQQQREARCPVSCTVSASPASSLREERKTESSECDPFIAHPPPTQRKTDYHSCKNKIKTPKNSSTRKQTENFKNQNKRKKQIKTAEVKLAGSQSAAAAAVVTHILPLRCLSPHTHTSPPLAHTHTHIGELVQLPCSASSAAAARRNE